MVALNKIDVEGVAGDRIESIQRELREALAEHGERLGRPDAVVCVSAVTGENTQVLLKASGFSAEKSMSPAASLARLP